LQWHFYLTRMHVEKCVWLPNASQLTLPCDWILTLTIKALSCVADVNYVPRTFSKKPEKTAKWNSIDKSSHNSTPSLFWYKPCKMHEVTAAKWTLLLARSYRHTSCLTSSKSWAHAPSTTFPTFWVARDHAVPPLAVTTCQVPLRRLQYFHNICHPLDYSTDCELLVPNFAILDSQASHLKHMSK
jgi:hypothetical protein